MNPIPPGELELRLLLEDFWKPRTPIRTHELPPAPKAPELRLLVEEYNPARRHHERYPFGHPEPPVPIDAEIDFRVKWSRDATAQDRQLARLASFAVHIFFSAILMLQPHVEPPQDFTEKQLDRERSEITLLAPSRELVEQLTRSRPGEADDTQIFRGAPEIPMPTPLRPRPEVEALRPPTPQPPVPLETEQEPPPDPDPPQLVEEQPPTQPEEQRPTETAANTTPAPGQLQRGRELRRTPGPRELPAPKAPTQEKPKLTLEDPKAVAPTDQGPVELAKLGIPTRPDQVINNAIQNMQDAGGGRQAVGDGVGAGAAGGYTPPSEGNIGSGLELLSDPKGVDFRPYLLQILNSVRRNWYAVIPESARLGMNRGRVAIQFSIDKSGNVPKLVIADPSGTQPLDRAAVAGISASLPFPPLPAEFSGDVIKLQFVFQYNMR